MSFYGNPQLGTRFTNVLRGLAEQPGQPFLDALPEARLAQIAAEENVSFGNRPDTIFTPAVTTWAFILQAIAAKKSCVAAVAGVIVLMIALERPAPVGDSGPYCKARAKLPLAFFQRACRELATEVEDQAPDAWRWHGRRVVLLDGTEMRLPDTPENQREYPQSGRQRRGLGFPLMRVVMLVALATAVILDAADGPRSGKETGETALARQLLGSLRTNDVVVADRYHCSYWQIALMRERGAHVVARLHQRRRYDDRRDQQVVWNRPRCPSWMDAETYARMPEILDIRIVRVQVTRPGYRTRLLRVATTLLNRTRYSADDIGDLYHRRWHIETDLNAIKTTMRMEELVCKTPEMVRKELWAHLLAYNLVRRVMAAAALAAGVLPRQLSFAGATGVGGIWRGVGRRGVGHAQAWCIVGSVFEFHRQASGGRPPRSCGASAYQASATETSIVDGASCRGAGGVVG